MNETLIPEALIACLCSSSEFDRNYEPANVVDALFAIARALQQIAVSLDNLPTGEQS